MEGLLSAVQSDVAAGVLVLSIISGFGFGILAAGITGRMGQHSNKIGVGVGLIAFVASVFVLSKLVR